MPSLERRQIVGRGSTDVGDYDFLLRAVALDLDAYRRFQIEHLLWITDVQSVKIEIPMQKIKQSTELPL